MLSYSPHLSPSSLHCTYADAIFETSADLGPLGNYPGSPFLPSDSDILLDSPDQEDIGIQKSTLPSEQAIFALRFLLS